MKIQDVALLLCRRKFSTGAMATLCLADERKWSMGELAFKIGQSGANLTGTTNYLFTLGLVVRVPHPKDRRSLMVVTTEEGRKIVAELQGKLDLLPTSD